MLTLAEFEAQLDAVASATSAGELHALLQDERVEELPARMVGADVGQSDLARLEQHLAPGEQTYWVGHPYARAYLSGQDVFLLPLAAFGTLISGLGVWGVPFPFRVVPLLILAACLEVLVGRFVFPSRRRRRTLYAVTDRRVISLIRHRWLGDHITDLYLNAIPRITIYQARSRRGTLLFGDAARYDELKVLSETVDEKLATGVGFYNIEDPETIKTLVETARQRASVRTRPDVDDLLGEHS